MLECKRGIRLYKASTIPMSELETTEMKLRTTPTGGMAGEHSPYYRRLLSAGYKGYLQGSIGGAGLYGFMGAIIGTLVAVPAMFVFPPLGAAALWLIPVTAGVGVAKGASTFGNIGTVAAISAESADLAEQRRYLLDRYYELPEGPEGDKQAEIIKQELTRQNVPEKGRHLFHWKTVAICAAIGAAVGLAVCTPIGWELLGGPVAHALEAFLGHHVAGELLGTVVAGGAFQIPAAAVGIVTSIATGLGALMGSVIGVDRSYVRRWFDGTETLLHDESHAQKAMAARSQQVDRIKNAAAIDAETKRIIERRGELRRDEALPDQPAPQAATHASSIASLDTAPDTRVHAATQQSRLADIQKAMEIPIN